jgi:hypothetical protein
MDFGNARKRKMLDAATRRKIDDGSMSIMNDSLLGDTTMDQSTSTNGSLNDSKQSVANEISLLKTVSSKFFFYDLPIF